MTKRFIFTSAACFLTLLSLELVLLLGSGGDLIGYDFVFFIPRLISTSLLWHHEGLFSIPWYTPAVCGGLPLFSEPQSIIASIPQLLMQFLPPWDAILAGSVVYLCLMWAGTYFLADRVVGLERAFSFAAACFFAAGGFFFSRTFSGALHYQQFALLPLLFLVQFWKSEDVPRISLLLGLLLAYVVNAGGYLVILFFLFDWISIAAIIQISAPEKKSYWVAVIFRSVFGVLISVSISAAKLVAVQHFLRLFPRPEHLDRVVDAGSGLRLIFSQLFAYGAYRPFPWMHWEYNLTLTPMVLLGLVLLCVYSFKCFSPAQAARIRIPAVAIFVSFLAIMLLATGFGLGANFEKLPILGSFRANLRFTSALVLPIVLLAALGWQMNWRGSATKIFMLISAAASLLTPLPLFSMAPQYALLPAAGIKEMTRMEWSKFQSIRVASIRGPEAPGDAAAGGRHFAFCLTEDAGECRTLLGERAAETTFVPVAQENYDIVALMKGESNLTCTNPYLEQYVLRYYPAALNPGSVERETNGKFNMANPACLAFPEENNCTPGALISATDRENLERLISFKQTRWKIPRSEEIALQVSTVCAIAAACAAIFFIVQRLFHSGR